MGLAFACKLMLKGCESCLGCWHPDPGITPDSSPRLPARLTCSFPSAFTAPAARPWALCLSLGYLPCFPLTDSLFRSHIFRLTFAFPQRAQLCNLPKGLLL